MKIAVISEVYIPKVDGVVRRTMNLIRHLQQFGDEVRVYCPEADAPRMSPVPVVEFRGFPCPSYPEYIIGRPDERLVEDLNAFRPDIIHVLNPLAFGFQCCELMIRSGIDVPLVFSFHTLYAEFVKTYPLLKVLSRPIWWLTRHYHNKADLNLTVSAIMADELRDRDFHNVVLWPPAVDSEAFSPQRRNWDMRCRLSGNHPEQPLVLTVSRLAPEKNVAFLADVMRQIPEACLAIVGEGPQRAQLERRFSPVRTHFVGYLHGDDLAKAYASADVFMYASETETMGNVILEAQASGLPVIAANAGGVRGLIENGKDGLMYKPRSTNDAVASLRNVLRDPRLRTQLSASAVLSASKRSWPAAAVEVRDQYRHAIKDYASRPSLPFRKNGTDIIARVATSAILNALATLSKISCSRSKFTRSQRIPKAPVHNPVAESVERSAEHLKEKDQERILDVDRRTHDVNPAQGSYAVSDHG
ncbi:MAG: glycosyltransferase family 1 protein [Planctomyces sp.]|nr:glycosyltransferase family 1 protein [Planctomyces sp.]